MDNQAFLWQPAATLSRTTNYDPASPINALTKVDGVAQVHDGRGNRTGAAGRTSRYDSRNMLVGANAPGMAVARGPTPFPCHADDLARRPHRLCQQNRPVPHAA